MMSETEDNNYWHESSTVPYQFDYDEVKEFRMFHLINIYSLLILKDHLQSLTDLESQPILSESIDVLPLLSVISEGSLELSRCENNSTPYFN